MCSSKHLSAILNVTSLCPLSKKVITNPPPHLTAVLVCMHADFADSLHGADLSTDFSVVYSYLHFCPQNKDVLDKRTQSLQESQRAGFFLGKGKNTQVLKSN